MSTTNTPNAVICVANDGNEVSLQLWKVYKPIRDDDAESVGLIRVIDESGEDYLFPAENFVPIDLPRGTRASFERAAREQRHNASASLKAQPRHTARVVKSRSPSKRRTA